jgi:hypothetical protein
VNVTCRPNEDPIAVGCHLWFDHVDPEEAAAWAMGLPVCEATVEFSGEGYVAMMGWVQFVRSTGASDGGHGFDFDPIGMYWDLSTPFGWFGIAPTLFDAPSLAERPQGWVAHSFLCVASFSWSAMTRPVRAILGFRWGFESNDTGIEILPPSVLPEAVWDAHVPDLAGRFSDWRFDAGYRRD